MFSPMVLGADLKMVIHAGVKIIALPMRINIPTICKSAIETEVWNKCLDSNMIEY